MQAPVKWRPGIWRAVFGAGALIACAPGLPAKSSALALVDPASHEYICGAAAVGAHEFVTAAHCWRAHGDGARIMFESREMLAPEWATLTALDETRDLALFATDASLYWHSTRAPRTGEGLFVIAPAFNITAYGVMGYSDDTSISVEHGFSGSPVYAVSDRRIVGIVLACHGTERSCEPGWSRIGVLR